MIRALSWTVALNSHVVEKAQAEQSYSDGDVCSQLEYRNG